MLILVFSTLTIPLSSHYIALLLFKHRDDVAPTRKGSKDELVNLPPEH